MNHVAIVHREYVEAILDGSKTIEARLARVRCAPYEKIKTGDRIYIKQSSGPYRARARVEKVRFFDGLTPVRVRAIRKQYNGAIGGPESYWQSKRDARVATLVWLGEVKPITRGPRIPKMHGRGWLVLSGGAKR